MSRGSVFTALAPWEFFDKWLIVQCLSATMDEGRHGPLQKSAVWAVLCRFSRHFGSGGPAFSGAKHGSVEFLREAEIKVSGPRGGSNRHGIGQLSSTFQRAFEI